MNRKIFKTITLESFALIVVLIARVDDSTSGRAKAQDGKSPYPNMAPVEQYFMADRNAEIALARTAAPRSISADASVLVLDRHGYETAVEGQEWFRVRRGTSVDVAVRSPGVLEPQKSESYLLQPARRAIRPAVHA